jgi:hypothetical protein
LFNLIQIYVQKHFCKKGDIYRIKEDFEKVEKQREGSDCEYYSKILSSSILKYLDSKKG